LFSTGQIALNRREGVPAYLIRHWIFRIEANHRERRQAGLPTTMPQTSSPPMGPTTLVTATMSSLWLRCFWCCPCDSVPAWRSTATGDNMRKRTANVHRSL